MRRTIPSFTLLPKARVLWAWLFLLVMLGHGSLEFALLADWAFDGPARPSACASAARPRWTPKPKVAEAPAHDCLPADTLKPLFAESKPACCEPSSPAPPPPKACACPLCDEHCPGGTRCRCDSHGREPKREGLFFVAPACHPSAPGREAPVPSSLGFRFLAPTSVEATPYALVERFVDPSPYHQRVASWRPLPATPPPRRAA